MLPVEIIGRGLEFQSVTLAILENKTCSNVSSSNKNSFEMYGVESKSVQSEFCIILYFQLVQNDGIELSDGRYSYDQIHLNNSIRSLRSFSCML